MSDRWTDNDRGKGAEQFVHQIAHSTFLQDWCFQNPLRTDGKELCDLLVVFGSTAIIWQIKSLTNRKDGKFNDRKLAKNARQLIGASRYLKNAPRNLLLENPRRRIEEFDPTSVNEFVLISAILGPRQDRGIFMREVKEQVVHVLYSDFVPTVLDALDTVSDFLDYFREKERLFRRRTAMLVNGGEEELLAFYLMNDRSLSRLQEVDLCILEEGNWSSLLSKPEYLRKLEEDGYSYAWDAMIETCHLSGEEYERVARELARPNRFQRRVLSKIFIEGWQRADSRARTEMYRRALVFGDRVYCFLYMDDEEPRRNRKAYLGALCLVARKQNPDIPIVIGIATEREFGDKCSYDFCLLEISEWTRSHDDAVRAIQDKLGILVNPTFQSISEDEYPAVQRPEEQRRK